MICGDRWFDKYRLITCPYPLNQHKKSPVLSRAGLFVIRRTGLFNTLTTQIIFVVTTEVDDLLRRDFQNTASQ